MESRIEQAIEFAIKYSNAAPEGFEKVAFQVALQHYLSIEKDDTGKVKSKQNKKHPSSQKEDYENSLDVLLKSDYDWSMKNISKLPSIDQYLTLLQIAKNDFDINMLAIDDIRKILQEKFRITKTPNNIGMTLMNKVGNYVDRIKVGNGYCYKITGNGESHLTNVEVDD